MIIKFLLQLESPNLDHQNSSYCILHLDDSIDRTESAHNSTLTNFLGNWGYNLHTLPSDNLFPYKYILLKNFNHSMWMSETTLMAKTLQPYPKQSIISELHELTFKSIFGSLIATICS